MITVVGILIYTHRSTKNPQIRGKIRIVTLGAFVGLVPVLALTILPNALFGEPLIPAHFVFLVLIVVPLSYGYAIVRHRLIEIEKHVNRGATQVLVFSLVGGIYFLLTALLNNITLITSIDPLIINTILVLFLASIFTPLRKKVQILVDQAFYGGWYDYRSAIVKITDGLEQITDLRMLATSLCQRTLNTLLLENIFLFLTGPKGDLSIYESYGKVDSVFQEAASFPILPPDSPLLAHLTNLGGPVDTASLRSSLANEDLLPEDIELLDNSYTRLWVPIYGREQISGILALGQKVGGDIYSVDDYYILGVVSRQVGPLIENIHLLTRLRQHAKELELRVEERTAELYDAKERVEAILASVGEGVFVTDLDGSIITVNNAFENQLYYSPNEVFSQDFYSLFIEDNSPEILADIRLTLREGEVWDGDLQSRRKDGTVFDVQLTIAPVRDQHGRMVGYVGSQRDITKQRELDRLKDQFISDVSHELRTPITNLSLYIGILEQASREKSAEYMSIIKTEIKRLTVLLEDILDLSRLKGKQLDLQPGNINDIINQVVDANKFMAITSDLDLEFYPGEHIPPVPMDENLVARVITNLVSNAIRYTPDGSIIVLTSMEDHKVCVQVKDTGMGIPSEDLPHIFDRFYRGREVRQTKIQGTGLGLAIVKEIVELHDGTIELISEVDQGTTINIWFPLEEELMWPEKLS
ncbi:MAG: ATP-binding protein [Nitrospirales bacterium]|nr:ATP-binding protein [Nitrospirales bacterium]